MLRLNCLYCGQPLRLNYRLTGPLLVFLTVLLVFLVPHSRSLCGCTAESLPPSAPHAITSQALYARECSRPSAPPRSSRPSSCTALPPSAPRAPHSRYSLHVPRAPPHAPLLPIPCTALPPSAPRAPHVLRSFRS